MASSSPMERISASIPDKVKIQLEEIAELEGRSFSNLIAYLLEQACDERYKLNERLGQSRPKD